jgi:hypothetical protein
LKARNDELQRTLWVAWVALLHLRSSEILRQLLKVDMFKSWNALSYTFTNGEIIDDGIIALVATANFTNYALKQ